MESAQRVAAAVDDVHGTRQVDDVERIVVGLRHAGNRRKSTWGSEWIEPNLAADPGEQLDEFRVTEFRLDGSAKETAPVRAGELRIVHTVLAGLVEVMARHQRLCEGIQLRHGRRVGIVAIPVVIQIEIVDLGVRENAPADDHRRVRKCERVDVEAGEIDREVERGCLQRFERQVVPVVVEQLRRRIGAWYRDEAREDGGADECRDAKATSSQMSSGHDSPLESIAGLWGARGLRRRIGHGRSTR